ncbi:hypothetical protein METUNv1_01720 [Methyloversatilis universalis FAM5]|uniref:Uncharacterized protein n=1 Tax=Methyloversatilis universalis (strain ATCC BAA-1314 / DSM 25237 / JCM 13912 / CCUG 52030 / FAM5) TaxID=1000565 RepID=F5RBS5_METUF|nr:hypothetical protein [Methyloversatilis universalis]EGK71942.1 hypothetical protein METUNv1_01720 [Methyloversatilis universalis FAM5]
MSAAAIIGNVVIYDDIFQGHVHQEHEGVLIDARIGFIDAVEFIPAGGCMCMASYSWSFAAQSLLRRERLS